MQGTQHVRHETHSYAELDAETLQLDLVRAETRGATPAVVFFHGGGWRSGERSDCLAHCRELALAGATGITASFRLASAASGRLPTLCVDDAFRCLRWVHENAARLGLIPQRIAAAGFSSGGQMAAAAATLGAPVTALVLFAPGLADDGSLRFAFLGADSPTYAVSSSFPDTLILHGTADSTVPVQSARAFAKSVQNVGGSCELIELPYHPNQFYDPGSDGFEPAMALMCAFLRSRGLCGEGPSAQDEDTER